MGNWDFIFTKKNGDVFAKMEITGFGIWSCSRIFSIIDQNISPLFESKDHPYKLNHEAIIDPSNNILKYDHALVVEVYLKSQSSSNIPFVPENTSCEKILNLLGESSAESADISFRVKGTCNYQFCDDDDLNNCLNIHALFGSLEEDEASPFQTHATIYAHLTILKACAPLLASLCKSYDKDHPVPISGVEPEIFRHLLRYLYGGKIPITELRSRPQAFLGAADRFCITDLKVEAEACFVNYGMINTQNVVNMYEYAVSKHCALLKEAAEDFFLKHWAEVLESSSSKKIMRALALDLLKLAMKSHDDAKGAAHFLNARGRLKKMTVDDLRRGLSIEGLSIDGTHSMLLSRLESYVFDGSQKENKLCCTEW